MGKVERFMKKIKNDKQNDFLGKSKKEPNKKKKKIEEKKRSKDDKIIQNKLQLSNKLKKEVKKRKNIKENTENELKEEFKKKEYSEETDAIEQVDTDPYLLKDAHYIKRNELWRNRQRVLLVRCPLKKKKCTSFIDNLKLLLPHNKVEGKWERKLCKAELNEISASRNCNNIIFFDVHRNRYCLWISKPETGPSLYFEILDYIPLHSLLFSGNCLLYSRPLLLFSRSFDEKSHLKLIKEMFIHVFGIPNYHPLSKPFYDHCYHFFYTDELIYFRHYQILPETLADSNDINKQKLVEIGPRFTLHMIKIFNGCFSGEVIYENKNYKQATSRKNTQLIEKQKKKFQKFNKLTKREYRMRYINRPMKSDMDI